MMTSVWERNAEETGWGRYLTGIERRTLQQGMAAAPAVPRIALEVGCDTGRWMRMLTDNGWLAAGTDIDPDAVQECQRRNPHTQCTLVDPHSQKLPGAAKSYGLVLCYEVFGVVHEPWFAAEVNRVLAPGGIFVATTHNRSSYRRYLWEARLRHRGESVGAEDAMYQVAYRRWRNEYVKVYGFSVVAETGMCWMPFSRWSNSKLIPSLTKMEAVGLRKMVSVSPWVAVVLRKA